MARTKTSSCTAALRRMLAVLAAGVLLAVGGAVLSACGDDDELTLSEVIVGTWVLEDYRIEGADDYEYQMDHLTLGADGRFEMVYSENDRSSGSYEAGDAYIRLDLDQKLGEQSFILCQVVSFSERQLCISYKDSEHGITVTVWLARRT